MKNPLPALCFGAACLAAMAGAADAFNGRRGTRVNPVDANIFEVVARSAGSGADYWCGAGDYAQRALRAAWTARIYIVQGRAPSVTTGRRSAVQFTLNPGAAGVTPLEGNVWSLNAMKPGDSMSVQQAQSYCAREPVRS